MTIPERQKAETKSIIRFDRRTWSCPFCSLSRRVSAKKQCTMPSRHGALICVRQVFHKEKPVFSMFYRIWHWLFLFGSRIFLTFIPGKAFFIVAYKTGTTQTVNLVLDIIRLAMQNEKKAAAELQLHSDQGSQYTSQAYFDLTKEYGITPSMSRRGNCYDNAMAENFFSILKTECIYRHQAATFE